MLLFVFVIVLALVLAWCCARKKCSWSRTVDRGSSGGNDDPDSGIKGPGTAGWLPRLG